MNQLTHCVFCQRPLGPHPKLPLAKGMHCESHGDYVIRRLARTTKVVVFLGFKPFVTYRCNETGKLYRSLISAAKDLNISQSDISAHLAGNKRMVKKYTFTKIENDGQGNSHEVAKPHEPPPHRRMTPIRCNETGVVYESVRQAERLLGIGRGNIHAHLLGRKGRKAVGGFTFTKVTSQKIHGLQ